MIVRRLIKATWGVTAATFVLMLADNAGVGPALEGRFWPVRVTDQIPPESVVRDGHQLRWTWTTDKLRMADSDQNVWLVHANGDRSYPEVYNCHTGVRWHSAGALLVGHHSTEFCIDLPPDLLPSEPVRLRQVITYRGIWGLWDLPFPLPDVVSPPGAAAP